MCVSGFGMGCSVHGLGGIGEPKVRPCFGIGPCIGRGRYMDWEVSEISKYGRVFVSGQAEHGLGPIPKPVPRQVCMLDIDPVY